MGPTPDELRREIEQRRNEIGNDIDSIEDRLSPGRIAERKRAEYGYRVRSRWQDMRAAVMGSPDDGNGSAGGGTVGRVKEAGSQVTDRVGDAPGLLKEQTRGAPIAVGLVSLGIGLLLGSLLPETRRERQLVADVQPQLEQVAADMGEAGQHAVSDLREPAQEALDHVKGAATDAAEGVREQASASAGEVRGQVTS